jgi:hypothetical protein
LIDREFPKTKRFYHLDQALEDDSGYSRSFWKKRVDAGEIKVLQRSAKRSGSRILIPRSEIVRVLSEMVR